MSLFTANNLKFYKENGKRFVEDHNGFIHLLSGNPKELNEFCGCINFSQGSANYSIDLARDKVSIGEKAYAVEQTNDLLLALKDFFEL